MCRISLPRLVLALSFALTSVACHGGPPPAQGAITLGGTGIALGTSAAWTAVTLQNEGNADATGVEVDAITIGTAHLVQTTPIQVGAISAGHNALVHATLTRTGLQGDTTYKVAVDGQAQFGSQPATSFALTGLIHIPPSAPGTSPAKNATAPAHKTSGAPYPHRTPRFNDQDNGSKWAVPVDPNAPLISPSKAASKPQPAPTGDPGGITFNTNESTGISSSTTAEPSGATGGGVTFMTSNWYAAYSTGGAWTQLDPTTIFPNDAIGYCCDQIVQYVPSIGQFVWLLQGNNGMRLATATPSQITGNNGTSWTYWDLPSTLFAEPSGSGYDYPDLSVGSNYLYMDWDACWPGNPTGCNSGREIVRAPLSEIKSEGTLNMNYTKASDSSDAWGAHLSQDTGSQIYWAGHDSNTQIRVFAWPESSNSYSWNDVNIGGWATSGISSTTPDNQDWMNKLSGFPGSAVIGDTVANGSLWLAWSAGSNNNFPQAHVEMIQVNPSNDSLIQQVQIWNPSYAYGYPALATNACSGEVGLSLEYGGGGNYENHVVGFWGDFVVYITTGSDVGTTRFGDYVTIRQDPTSSLGGAYFDAFGYGLDKTGTTTDSHYVLFGRSNCKGR